MQLKLYNNKSGFSFTWQEIGMGMLFLLALILIIIFAMKATSNSTNILKALFPFLG